MKPFTQKITILIVGFLGLLGALYGIHRTHFYQPVRIIVDAKISSSSIYQLFYDTGKDFNEQDSIKIPVSPSENVQSLLFTLPITPISKFRLDPGGISDGVIIKKITAQTNKQKISWAPNEIKDEFKITYDIRSEEVTPDGLSLTISGSDPWIVSPGNALTTFDNHNPHKKRMWYIFTPIIFCIGIVSILVYRERFFSQVIRNTQRILTKIHAINRNARFTFLFIIILLIPLSQMVFRYLPEALNDEQRALAEFPEVTLLNKTSTWHDYTQSLETYFNDHYGLRSLMISANSLLSVKYFKVSTVAKVMVGKDGWLYYTPPSGVPEDNFDDYYGKLLFTKNQLRTIQKNFLDLKNRLAKDHINLVVVLAANKQSVYEEFLPDYVVQKRGPLTKADQLATLAQSIDLNYVDTRQSLQEAKHRYPYPLFYKTDTHWNDLGSFVAFKDILKAVTALGYKVNNPYQETSPLVTVGPSPEGGDLEKMLNISGNVFDDSVTFVQKQKNFTSPDDLLGHVPIRTTLNDPTYPKVLVFRDSFFKPLIPYVSNSFSNVTYVWSQAIDYDLIKKEKPDIVIVEFAERFSNYLLTLGVQ